MKYHEPGVVVHVKITKNQIQQSSKKCVDPAIFRLQKGFGKKKST